MVWLVVVLFVAMTVAVLRGGRLTNLADIRLRWWLLLPVGFLIQWATLLLPDRSWAPTAGVSLIIVSYVCLVSMIFANRERAGMWLAGVGILLNLIVILANGGMPVLREAAVVAGGFTGEIDLGGSFNYKHVVLDRSTRLPFLADVIPMRVAGHGQVISLGDVFLAVGLGRFLEAELRRPVRWFKPGVKLQGGSANR
ncbi:MAG TPA: DUF5317 domain-containing protein [Acidimicrobiia bacterium]